jgi:hypothetical protein
MRQLVAPRDNYRGGFFQILYWGINGDFGFKNSQQCLRKLSLRVSLKNDRVVNLWIDSACNAELSNALHSVSKMATRPAALSTLMINTKMATRSARINQAAGACH